MFQNTICGFLPSYKSSPLSYHTGHVMLCRPPIPGGIRPHLHQILLICCEKHAGLPVPFASPFPQLDLVIRGIKVCRGLQGRNILLQKLFTTSPINSNDSSKAEYKFISISVSTSVFKISHWRIVTHHFSNSV